MPKKLDPRLIYKEAYQDRQGFSLPLTGNPYKLTEARWELDAMLHTARTAMQYERHPVKGGGEDSLGGCLARQRRPWTRKALAKGIPHVLGYDAVPGLEVMARPDLLARFAATVFEEILPAVDSGLALPQGEPMMVRLVDVLERTLLLIDETLAACEVAHA